jgi:DNA-binding NtrC family response regulator
MHNSNNNTYILIVDDAPDTLEVLQRNLLSQGYKVFTASNISEAIRVLEYTHIDLVITDYKMPEGSGIELIKHVRENFKYTEIMMITGYASIEGAVKAVKIGAEEYLAKPFTDEELFAAVNRSLEKLSLRKANHDLQNRKPSLHYGILGESEEMLNIYRSIHKSAQANATVLISGESGTGKELVARAIHYNSNRASGPFIPVNCGGIPEGLLESELFGHVKGAFTGATESRAGFFQTAEGGTILLDEISETSLSMQVKLLRVLQEKEINMVGSTRTQKIDVRILASTNKDLLNLTKKGTFREDLYYRLNVINITIPPLRNRGNDIIILAQHFANKYAKELEKSTPKFSDTVLQVLTNYYWPGNVRELENVIQRLVIMNDEKIINIPDLPSLMRFSGLGGLGLNRTLAEVEAEYISNVLSNVNRNKTRAAEILGIDRKTLREKMKKYSLDN